MKKEKKTDSIDVRPSPPSIDEIVSDIQRSADNDPVFSPVEMFCTSHESDSDLKIPDMKMSRLQAEDDLDQAETEDIQKKYLKACDMLKMFEDLKAKKSSLQESCQHLLNSKEDVSAVALQLKTRLEKHKLLKESLSKQ